jgi:hypothetical protein
MYQFTTLEDLIRRLNSDGKAVTLLDGATINVNAGLGSNFRVTLGGNRALANPTNLSDGQRLHFRIKQDGTGSRTLTFGSKYLFPGASKTLTTTASALDVVECQYDAADDTLVCTLNKAFA